MSLTPLWTVPRIDRGKIHYVRLKSGGYRLIKDVRLYVGINYAAVARHQFGGQPLIDLTNDGWLTIRAGYWWDGASGPVVDRKSNMRAGLVHDALYHLLRKSLIPQECREPADELYRRIYLADGGWPWVGDMDYVALRLFAKHAAKPQPEVEERALVAP